MKKVYISGPMSGLPEFNFPAFFEAAKVIRGLGYEPINPAEGVNDTSKPWEWYMHRALKLLPKADEIWLLPGWRNSRGANIELNRSQELGMPAYELILGIPCLDGTRYASLWKVSETM